MSDNPRAGLIIIGNEILSGRTLDKNTQHIAQKLGERGITLAEVRIIPDQLPRVVEAIHALRPHYDYIFTTGGLGPTHDDITVECIAAAFEAPVITHPEAYAVLLRYYGSEEAFTPARQRMARTPEGANLIDNPVSGAPGFVIGNVYAMAGVPKIMQAMLDNILSSLQSGALIHSRTLSCALPESRIADTLAQLQEANPTVEIGSYPFFHDGNVGVSVVLRSTDPLALDQGEAALKDALEKLET
jgi:molybdenum cofactor synthesis domain-containing protein